MTVHRAAKRRFRRQTEMSERERFRVTQLMVSGTVFVLLVAVKLLFPDKMALVREPLNRALDNNMDVAEVFAAVGNLVADRKAEEESLYQAVFGPRRDGSEVTDGDDSENAQPEIIPEGEETVEPAVIYTEQNMPERVNLQQVVLGFDYSAPVKGNISSYFGYRKNPTNERDRFHYGLDIAAEKNAEITAFADGIVTVTAESSSYGKYLIIAHENGCTTLYAHCEKIHVRSGQSVGKGEKIALVGDSGQTTGAHLHFELQQNDVYLNPVYYVV